MKISYRSNTNVHVYAEFTQTNYKSIVSSLSSVVNIDVEEEGKK